MKNSDIAKLIKKNHYMIVAEVNGVQWAGDGACLYPIFGMRPMTDDELLHFFDLGSDDVSISTAHLEGYDLSFSTPDDISLESEGPCILNGGFLYRTFYTEQGAFLFNRDYLRIVEKSKLLGDASVYYVLRRTAKMKRTYAIAKKGTEVFGLILPIDAEKANLQSTYEKFCSQLALASANGHGGNGDTAFEEIDDESEE